MNETENKNDPVIPAEPDVPKAVPAKLENLDISALLRDPAGAVEYAQGTPRFRTLLAFLVGTMLVGSGLFGFAVGSFVDLKVAGLDALKMMGVVTFAFGLTFPTFYVFACICGCQLKPLRVLAFGLVCMASLGCLLAALAPILWLFSVSTESWAFIVVFSIMFAVVSVGFAYRPIIGAVAKGLVATSSGLSVWFVLFFLVALQAVTLMRPMLSPLGSERLPKGKCFFLQHFVESATDEAR